MQQYIFSILSLFIIGVNYSDRDTKKQKLKKIIAGNHN